MQRLSSHATCIASPIVHGSDPRWHFPIKLAYENKNKSKNKTKIPTHHRQSSNLCLSVCVAILGKVWIDLYPFAANRRGSAEAAAIAAQIENQLEDQIWELIQKSRLPHNDKLKHWDRRGAVSKRHSNNALWQHQQQQQLKTGASRAREPAL